jgi:hypothetical protein
MSEPRVPDVAGEALGWRAWQLVGTLKVPRLMSINAAGHAVSHEDAIWPTKRWFIAMCPRGHIEDIPVEGCSCGLYAARDREHLVKLAYGSYGADAIHVIGEVGFAGKVIPGSQGWKAERGRIRSLVVPYEFWRYADPLAEAYNVPVTVGFLFPESVRREVLGG